MAAPSKARLSTTCFALFVVSLILSAYSARNPWTRSLGASIGSLVVVPLQRTFQGGASFFTDTWSRYIALVDTQRKNEALLSRLAALEAQNSKLLELDSENNRLRALLSYRDTLGTKGIAAKVIGLDPSNWRRVVTVNAGKEQNVYEGMPALSGNGLIGQVVSAGYGSSRIVLISDHSSGVDALLQGSRFRGVIKGKGDLLSLEYVLTDQEVALGERVITSGLDGVYPKGLFIGVVTKVDAPGDTGKMLRTIEVTPTVDLKRIEEVLLISPPNHPLGEAP